VGVAADAALPPDVVRLAQSPDGIELYFPPLRRPQTALALGMFGLLAIVLPAYATTALIPAGDSDAHNLLVLALIGSFVAPFLVFGTAFIALAIYMLGNSLTVRVSATTIGTVRRVFGIALKQRELQRADIAAIEPEIAARYQNVFAVEPCYRLVAQHRVRPGHGLVVAESLTGELLMARVKALIDKTIGLDN
jgi:hypothetical protein